MNLSTFERLAGAPLDAVRAWLGADVVEVTSMSRVRPDDAVRGTVRVTLADGRQVKLRRAASEAHARDVATLLEALDEPALPRALFVSGRVLVEPWIAGVPLDGHPAPVPHARALGALLGRVHSARVAGRTPASPTASTDAVRARFERHVADLADAGVLGPADADGARALVAAMLPARADVGVVHRDLCAENVVVTPAGLDVVVDNESMRVGELDGDLARTFARWPMDAASRAAFLAGYATHRDPATALRDERAWRTLAVTKSLHVRVVRLRVPAADVLADLRALLADDVTRS